jgi:hypothetical protein
MILPGWDSLETVAKVHRFFEIGGIVCLGLLVLFEAFAYVYGHRLETLSAAAQQQRLKEALDRQNDQLKSQYGQEMDTLKSRADSLTQDLSVKKQAEQEAERIRRTPPKIIAGLVPVTKGKVIVSIVSQNLIPFQYRYTICTKNNLVVAGFPMGMSKVYPREGQASFSFPTDIQLDRVQDGYLEFRFTFMSLSYEELHLPGHAGEIVVKYKLGPDEVSLQQID